VNDGRDQTLEIEHRHAEMLLAHGELDAAEHHARRLVGHACVLGRRHYRGVGHAVLAEIQRARRRRRMYLAEGLDALRHLDHQLDPALFCRTVFALCRDLSADGAAPRRFGTLVREIRRRRTSRGDLPWSLLRWLEGRTLYSRGQAPRAATFLSGARRRCLARGASGPAVGIALDLADAHLDAGDARAARVMIRDTLRAVEDLDLDAEPLAAFRDYAAALTEATVAGVDGGSGIQLGEHVSRVQELLFG
jgi:hypothetical protein